MTTIYDPPRARRPWMLMDVLPEGARRYYSLGRWALVDALRACGVGSGDRVLVPGLICREVLASVDQVGASAVFYPVSPQLRPACSARDLISAKAVIAVNYFGFPQDLEPFREYCARTGAALVEDNAHGLFSRDEQGRLLGSRGDAGVFSIRKTIAVPDGGALVLANRELPEAGQTRDSRNGRPRYRVKQAFRRAARGLGPIRTHQAIGALRAMRRAVTGHAVPVVAPASETDIPIGPNPSPLLSHALKVADPDLEAQRRRALYELTGRILNGVGTPVFPQLLPNVVPYGFPVVASSAQAPGIEAQLGRHGLPFTQWPDLPAAIAPSAPEHYRHLWVVPFLW